MSHRNSSPVVLVYASQLAAFIGQHKYQSPAKAFEMVWNQIDGGNHWGAAVERVNGQSVTRDEAVRSICTKYSMNLGEHATPHRRPARPEADRVVQEKQLVVEKIDNHVKNSSHANKETLRRETDAVKEIIFDDISSEYGNQAERRSIKAMNARNQQVSHNNSRFYKSVLFESSHSGRRYGIGGRIDGLLSDGTLVEIKNRQNRLFTTIPMYERIQLECYLRLTGAPSAKHVQHLKRSWTKEPDESITEVQKNDEFWIQDLLPRMAKYFIVLDYFLRVPKWQEVFLLCTTMEDREEFLESLHKKIFEQPQNFLRYIADDSDDE